VTNSFLVIVVTCTEWVKKSSSP